MHRGTRAPIVTVVRFDPAPAEQREGVLEQVEQVSQVREAIERHVVEEFLNGDSSALPADDANLIEAEIIDSLGIFLLVDFLQERFGIEIDAEEINIENFTTIESICSLVTAKQKSG
jgi:acyl carrier protein